MTAICYPEAGHWIGIPGYTTMELAYQHPHYNNAWMSMGGTPAGTAHAQRKGWGEVLKFLDKNLKSLQ